MQKSKIEQIDTVHWVSFLVILASLMVMAGWVFDIGALKSILPQWVTMKFSTAFSFLLSGITVYIISISLGGTSPIAQIVLPVTTLGLLLPMAIFLISTVFDLHTGVEDLFVQEAPAALKTTAPGRPSVGTMINFILIAAAGIFSMLFLNNLKSKLLAIGRIICVIGGVAVLGYVLNLPLLYYAIEGWSTAMAFHTAILFVMLGTGIIFLKDRVGGKPSFLSIQRKFIIVFLAISVIPAAFAGSVIFTNVRTFLEQTALERLRAFAEFKEGEIFLFLDSLEIMSKGIASDGRLISKLNGLVDQAPEKELSIKEFNEYLRAKALLDEKLLAIDVLDPKGKVVASSHPEMIGLDKSGERYFEEGGKNIFIKDTHFETNGVFEVDIATPIKNAGETAKPTGVLVAHYNASMLNDVISGKKILEMGALTQAKGIGKSGNTYLVNQDSMIITDSHFIETAALKQKWSTLPVKKCFEENKEVTGDWLDYRGVPVMGASMCVSFGGIKWTLVSQQDKAEIFAEINKLRSISFFIVLLSVALVFLVAISIAKSISKPIQALQKGAEIVGAGNLDHKVGIPETDEIGRLSSAFDLMAQRLKITMGRLGSVMQMAPVGVAISSLNGNEGVTDVNLAFLKMFGYNSREELTRLPVSVFFTDPMERDQLNEHRKKGVVMDFEARLKRKDGSVFPASISSLTFSEEDGKTLALSIIQDISERKRAEEDLLRLKDRAEDANRLKSEFLANVSHELRTPLTALIGFPDIIREILKKYPRVTWKDMDNIMHCNEIVSKQSKKLLAIIDDLIDLTKFEAETFELRESPILAHPLISSITSIFKPLAEKKKLELTDNRLEQADFSFMGDIKRLEQILFKLLDNAIKFSKKGVIRLSAVPLGGKIIFQVEDEGVGLTEEESRAVFDRFHQLDGSSTREQGGLGVGLNLVKKIVDKMGGDVSVRSVKGKGTAMSIELPWRRPEGMESAAVPRPENAHGALKGKKILVVDDEPNIQFFVRSSLPDNELTFAENGAEAMEILETKQDFDFILLDRRMPVMDGDQFMSAFAARHQALNIPIVMLTASALQEEVDSAEKLAQKLGLKFMYVTKPFSQKSLIAAFLKMKIDGGLGPQGAEVY